MRSCRAKMAVRPASRRYCTTKCDLRMSGREAPRGRPPYRDIAPAAGPRDRRCAGCLPYRVQRSPCRHSASDCFVACFVRAAPVFFAMFFPDEHNAPDERALSSSEMGSALSVSCQRAHAGGRGPPWSRAHPTQWISHGVMERAAHGVYLARGAGPSRFLSSGLRRPG